MVKLINATSPVCGKEVFTFGPRLVPVAGPVDPGLQHIYDPSYDPTAQLHTEEDRSSRPGQIRRRRRSGYGISDPEENWQGSKGLTGTDEGISIFKRIVRLVNQDRDDEDDDMDVFFDWAQGNLEEFWGINRTSTRDGSHLAWMAEQFFKLSISLHRLHRDLESLGTEHLEMGAKDFAHLSPRLSIFDTHFRHKQPTYRAPEDDLTDGSSRSLSSGIFSMGCVFLEYVTWFLTGEEGVEEFSWARTTPETDSDWILSDIFFTMSQDGHIATLKMEVKGWIRHLEQQPECSSVYLCELLNFIESRMLEPDPRKRAGIEATKETLEMFRHKCRLSKAFYQRDWKECESFSYFIGTPSA